MPEMNILRITLGEQSLSQQTWDNPDQQRPLRWKPRKKEIEEDTRKRKGLLCGLEESIVWKWLSYQKQSIDSVDSQHLPTPCYSSKKKKYPWLLHKHQEYKIDGSAV